MRSSQHCMSRAPRFGASGWGDATSRQGLQLLKGILHFDFSLVADSDRFAEQLQHFAPNDKNNFGEPRAHRITH